MTRQRIQLGPGQESVWDYPRPPAIEPFTGHLRIVYEGEVIMDTNDSFRILETSHPPTYYIPVGAFKEGSLIKTSGTSYCEWKGMAEYFNITAGDKMARKCAWGYANPKPKYSQIKDHVSVYAHMMEACYVNDEPVQAQEGDFYGGWITSNIVGPFKGGPGTWGW